MEKNTKKKINFYEVLEVDKEATNEQIKSSYKRLALKWHPDKNNNSEESTEKFKLISEAYSILINPERRRHYDRYGTVMDDDDMESEYFSQFEQMFGSFGMESDIFLDIDMFADMLETDTKYMKKVFKNLGSSYRNRGKRRKQAKGSNKMDDIMTMLMMPEMMGMTDSKIKNKSKNKQKQKQSNDEDEWESASDNDNNDNKNEDGWETLSEEEVQQKV